jgi:hypothetical protein
MSWRIRLSALVALVASLLSFAAHSQQTLYAATGSGGATGNLYIVDPATATAVTVGPILAGGLPIAITGLAFDPTSGLLYAITSNSSPNIPRHLVTINRVTAAATDIGALGIGGADIAFGADGTLYMSSGNATSLFTVNKTTGVATVVGPTGTGDSGSGLSIDSSARAFFSGTSSTGTLDRLNLATGAATIGPTMNGPGANVGALAFNSGGGLFGALVGAPSVLVTINTSSGAVTTVGNLPANIDAMAFSPPPVGVPTLSEWSVLALVLLLALTAFVAMRRRIA